MILDLSAKIAVAVIGLSNLILGIFVFKFNFKKDSFSKISLRPLKTLSLKEDETFANRTLRSLTDLEYVNDINDEDIHFHSVKDGGNYRYGSKNGYCSDDLLHEMYDWAFEVQNKGDFPSTNIEIEYEITVYKLFRAQESEGVYSYTLSPDFVLKRTETIDYIAADDTKKIFISTINGEFPRATISVLGLKSSQMKYIKKPTLIDNYVHPTLMNSAHIDVSLFEKLAGVSQEEVSTRLNRDLQRINGNEFFVRKEDV